MRSVQSKSSPIALHSSSQYTTFTVSETMLGRDLERPNAVPPDRHSFILLMVQAQRESSFVLGKGVPDSRGTSTSTHVPLRELRGLSA